MYVLYTQRCYKYKTDKLNVNSDHNRQFKSVKNLLWNIRSDKTNEMPNRIWDTIGVVRGIRL